MDTTQMLYLAGAFVLGFIVAWLAGRNGPKRALEECEANGHSLQRSLDDRTRTVSKLEDQLKEQTNQADRLGSEQSKLNAALKTAEQGAADANGQVAQLQMELSQTQAGRLELEAELGQIREAYADTRKRLAQSEARAAQAASATAEESTALAVADAGRAAEVEQLTAQVQSLEGELEAVRANAARLAGQVALRPQLTSTQQQEYAALAGDPERVVAALHQRDMAVADARAETDYLRRTVGMLTGMGAELANELERRRREQHALLYQVAGLTAVTREVEMRQLVDRQAPPATTGASSSAGEVATPAGPIEPESQDLPVSTPPDSARENGGEAAGAVAAALALDLRRQLDGRTKELEELRAQTDPLQANLDKLQAEIDALNAAKADLEAQLGTRDSDLGDLQSKLVTLQADADSAAVAKGALEDKLQLRGVAWSGLVARVAAINADLDALIAAEPGDQAAGETAPAEEVAALAATAPADDSVPEAARAADAVVPVAESGEEAPADSEQGQEDAESKATLNKLAAGVAAAIALFKRKNGQLADYNQQMDALAGDKSALESTLAAKDQSLVAAQATVEQLQTGLNQRSQRFDALSMHASSLEADMDIREIERAKLEEQVRAVAADLQALTKDQVAPAEETAVAAEPAAADQVTGVAGAATPQSPLDELTVAATAVAELLRSKDSALQAAHTELGGLQGQLDEYGAARQSLTAELETKGASMADVEARLQALQGDYSGAQATQGELEATLMTLGEQLRNYLAEYGEPQETVPQEAEPQAGETPVAAPVATTDTATGAATDAATEEPAAAVSPAAALAAVAAIGELLKRRKDALESSNVRIGDLDAEITAMTSQKSEMDARAEQQEQVLADLTAQLEAAQADLATQAAEAEALKQQLADVTAQLEAAQADLATHAAEAETLKQQLADVTAQLDTAQAEIAQRTTDVETLTNQLAASQAQAAATEQERVRLDAQLRSLDENLAQFGAALDADDETAVTSLAERLGAEAAPADDESRSIDAPLVKTAGAVAVAGIAGKKLVDLRAANAQLSELQEEHAALTSAKDDLESQLQSQTAALEDTKAQLATIQAQLTEANAQHADEIQVLDAKSAELQSSYNEAEATRLRLEASLAALNQELQQLGVALDSDDDEGLQQFMQKAPSAELQAGLPADAGNEQGNGGVDAVGVATVAAVAAAIQRKQAALKEADARAAAIQAQLDEVSADREAAKALLADRDLALQEAETRLTEATLQTEVKVSDFKAAARAAAEARGIEVQMVRVLQDFADLKHIGVTFEQRLYRAGAGTYWEVAHVTDDDFAVILRLTEMQRLAMDFNETRDDALRLAEQTGMLGAISEGDTPDDFEPIQGIGKVFEQRLYTAGIRTYWDLANASEEQLADICKARKPLVPNYAAWIRQARIYAEVRSDS